MRTSELQKEILEEYRLIYPGKTLQQTSWQTKIQITRVFRIFKGSEMKISEYEAFMTLLNKKNKTQVQKKTERNASTKREKIENFLNFYLSAGDEKQLEELEMLLKRKLAKKMMGPSIERK